MQLSLLGKGKKMSKYAVIKDGVIINLAEAEASFAEEQGWVLAVDYHDSNEKYKTLKIGDYYSNGFFTPAPRNLDHEWSVVRSKRDQLLQQSDILVAPDRWASYTTEKQLLLANYRQTLRDIPQNFSDPATVVWPTIPT